MGNYGSPSNAKFVPNQSPESFEKIVKASKVQKNKLAFAIR